MAVARHKTTKTLKSQFPWLMTSSLLAYAACRMSRAGALYSTHSTSVRNDTSVSEKFNARRGDLLQNRLRSIGTHCVFTSGDNMGNSREYNTLFTYAFMKADSSVS